MPAFLIPILAAIKPLAISWLAGYAMKGVVSAAKAVAPKFWQKIPEAVRPYVSTALGVLAGAVAGDPALAAESAIAGAAGGLTGKAAHDGEKKPAQTVEAAIGMEPPRHEA